MDEFRLWWAGVIKSFVAWIEHTVTRISYGLLHEWELSYLIFGLGAVLIVGMFTIWRRKA